MTEWVQGVLSGHRLRVLRHGRRFRARCECDWLGDPRATGAAAAQDAGMHKIEHRLT